MFPRIPSRLASLALGVVFSSLVLASQPQVNVAGAPDTRRFVSLQTRPDPNTPIHIGVSFKNIDQAGSTAFVASQYDPESPNFHQWITMDEFGKRFGANDTDIAAVSDYLKAHGFKNVNVASTRLFVTADGTFANIESAFNTKMGSYVRPAPQVAKGEPDTFYAPITNPQLPADIASKVEGVNNLSNILMQHPASFHLKKAGLAMTGRKPSVGVAHSPKVALAAQGSNPYGPFDIAAGYNTLTMHKAPFSLFGQSQKIAVYSPTLWYKTNVDSFASYFNAHNGGGGYSISGYTVNDVVVDTGPTDYSGSDEAGLDAEMIVGQAPKATVDMFEPPNSGQGELDAFTAVGNTAGIKVLSSSWAFEEDQIISGGFQSFANDFNNTAKALASAGVSIFIASGDNGAFDRSNSSIVTTTMEASAQYTTGVGGTEVDLQENTNPDTDKYLGETTWQYNATDNSGGGGGVSQLYARPSWQMGPGVLNSYSQGGSHREVPDVAGNGGPDFPYAIYLGTGGSAGWYNVWGTSASTPLWASNALLINQEFMAKTGKSTSVIGFASPVLYWMGYEFENPAADFSSSTFYLFHDITKGPNGVPGTNGKQPCTPYWDFCTGWGSADFTKLMEDLGMYNRIPGFAPDFAPTNNNAAWKYPILIHTTAAGFSEPSSFSHTQTLFFGVCMSNLSTATSDGIKCFNALYIDGVLVSKPNLPALPRNYSAYTTAVTALGGGYYSTMLTAGQHTIKFVVNYTKGAYESNYNNDTYTRTITVN